MKRSLQTLLKENSSMWLEKITKPPYCLRINEDENYILFKYDQINSDFSNKIVRESRGIIFHKDTWDIVCRPFDKFFNYGEKYAANIDWSSARIQEKIDGSILKLWYHNGEWHLSTNGLVNATQGDLPIKNSELGIETFSDLFIYVAGKNNYYHILECYLNDNHSILDTSFTYIFEIASIYNKVVVPFEDPKLYHIGTRHNETGQEIDYDIEVEKPKEYQFNNLQEVIDSTINMPYSQEGYVVVDKNYNRIKVKSPAYLAVHRLKGEDVPTPRRVLDIIRIKESSEFLNYFPEYKFLFDKVYEKWIEFINKLNRDAELYFIHHKDEDRKTLAQWAKTTTMPDFIFKLRDEKVKHYEEYLQDIPSEKLVRRFML